MNGMRKRRRHNFVQVPRETIRDSRLSWKARGLLAFLLDHPDGWVVNSEQLAEAGPDGRDAVRSGLKELREQGYYRLERRRLLDGSLVMGTAISEDAVPEWAQEHVEFEGGAVDVLEVQPGEFAVRHRDGSLTGDGFPVAGFSDPGEPVSPPSTGAGVSDLGGPGAFKRRSKREGNNYPSTGGDDGLDGIEVSSPVEGPDDGPDDDPGGGSPSSIPGSAPSRRSEAPLSVVRHQETPRASEAARGPSATFDEFWAECPRKVGKGAASKAWAKAIKKATPREIIDGMKAASEHWQRTRTETRFIPHPATWLNAERWADEIEQPQQPQANPWAGAMTSRQYRESLRYGQ